MQIQSASAAYFAAANQRSNTSRQHPAASAANSADTVSISQAARDAFAASMAASMAASIATAGKEDQSVAARLAAIKASGPINRSREDNDFLFAHDKRLAAISAQGKPPEQLTAEELDYMQQATGMVNTMANLSPAEKALYNRAVAGGNAEAAAGISQIALVRMMGHTAGGANGSTYDPLATEITARNIEQFFSHSIVDPTGQTHARFQALIQFLQGSPVA